MTVGGAFPTFSLKEERLDASPQTKPQQADIPPDQQASLPPVGRAIAVAANELRVDAAHELDDLDRLRPEEQVASEDDCVDAGGIHVGEHGFERPRHPVHVVQRRDSHPGS